MAKLYNKKGKVHPSPPSVADQLALLPAAILTLVAALSPGDREVLAYLISCSNNASSASPSGGRRGATSDGRKNREHEFSGEEDHPPMFQCDCFRCYKSFWSRWDSSPNRQEIHEIIDAYEDGLFRNGAKSSNAKKKKQRRKGQNRVADCGEDRVTAERTARDELGEQQIEGARGDEAEVAAAAAGDSVEDGEVESEKGTVRKIASFIAEKIWGVWNRT